MSKRHPIAILCLVTGGACGALAVAMTQDPPPGQAKGAEDDPKADFLERVGAEGIELDFASREVSFPGTFMRGEPSPEYPIEYPLISTGGATHEGLAITDCTPSVLNACLLAIGLERAQGREFTLKDPLPSREDVLSGLENPYDMIAPEGERVFLYVSWTDAEGQEQMHPIEDLLLDWRTGEPLPLRGFLYLGSRFATIRDGNEKREAYMADYERNIVTFVPTQAPSENCLFDVYAIDLEPYAFADINARKAPAAGQPLRFILTPRLKPGTRALDVEKPPEAVRLPDLRELKEGARNPYLADADEQWVERVASRELADYLRMLKKAQNPLREISAAVLGTTGRPDVVEALYDSLRLDRSEDVRLSCAFALAQIGDRSAVLRLVDVLGSRNLAARREAMFALKLFSGEDLGADAESWRTWTEARFGASRDGD